MTLNLCCSRFCVALTAVLLAAPNLQAQDSPAATADETVESETIDEVAEEEEEIDPYEVPEGTAGELLEYIETAPNQMQPQSREDLLRMFESLGLAADRILADEEAKPNERMAAVKTKMQTLGMLARVGQPGADTRMEEFLKQALADKSPEIQAFAKNVRFQRQLGRWSDLSPEDRAAVVAEMRENLSGENFDKDNLIMLMRFADSVAETADAPLAIELIDEVMPRIEASEDAAIASRAESLAGIARRLQLPGNIMELEGKLLDGKEVDWESYRGKVVLVDFWATWCGPCIAELPNVLRHYEAYHDKGFEVLGISLDDDAADVQAFIEDNELPWATLYSDDPEATGWHHPMATRYGINAIPRAILVDQEGNVVHMNARGKNLAEALSKLLGPIEEMEDGETSDEKSEIGETASTEP